MAASYEAHFLSLTDDINKYIVRDDNWSLDSTLAGILCVVAIYLMLVLKILPAYMKNRDPLNLKQFLYFYNALQVIYSVYLVAIYTVYLYQYGLITTRCSTEKQARLEIIKSIRPYFIAKHIDLLDTVIFVLRKKTDQISFLHLYHHGVMIAWTWLHFMHYPNDNFTFVGFLNSFVHILMYTYYGIAALGPKYSKYIWWKKHLTKIQLVQFLMVLLQMHQQQYNSGCPVPGYFHWFCITNISAFFLLFLNFYIRSYRKNFNKMESEPSSLDKTK